MAIELITKKWCDVHMQKGEEVDAETIKVSFNGERPQEIELCTECQDQYMTPLQKLLTSEGRTKNGQSAAKGGRRAASSAVTVPSSREIRDWGRANGFDVPARGKIPSDLHSAYRAAH